MSRNAAGTYTLPAGNPVVTGTLVESTWANPTMSDIASEITDSLSRSGKGSMNAVLGVVAGSAASPGVQFNSDTDTGIYRSSANVIGIAAGGAAIATFSGTEVEFQKPFDFASAPDAVTSRGNLSAQEDVITTRGDIVVGDSSGAASRLAIGAAGTVPVSDGTDFSMREPFGVVQLVSGINANYLGLSSVTPLDDTAPPQITEGAQVVSASITPTHASNRIACFVSFGMRVDGPAVRIVHLHRSDQTDAINVTYADATSLFDIAISMVHVETAGGTSPVTFSVRIGTASGASTYINGDASTRLFGGAAKATLILAEIKSN